MMSNRPKTVGYFSKFSCNYFMNHEANLELSHNTNCRLNTTEKNPRRNIDAIGRHYSLLTNFNSAIFKTTFSKFAQCNLFNQMIGTLAQDEVCPWPGWQDILPQVFQIGIFPQAICDRQGRFLRNGGVAMEE